MMTQTSRSTDLKQALEEAEAELAAVYRRLWPLREAYAEAVPPGAMPRRRDRTDKQALVARCPRCGGKLDEIQTARSMLEELTDACEWLSLYPEGAVGIEELREVQHKARGFLKSEGPPE